MLNLQPVSPAKILLVEDEDDLAELIEMHLAFQGHEIVRVANLSEARSVAQKTTPDLIVLDRGLPDGDGLMLVLEQQKADDSIPTLLLTALDSEKDKVEGLEAGAEDYLTKPFSVLEFQARVRTILRRNELSSRLNDNLESTIPVANQQQGSPISQDAADELVILPERHKVQISGRDLSLTATEFALLDFLASKPGRVFSKDELLSHVWDCQYEGYHHTVSSTINRLRTKLEQVSGSRRYIHTVWGVGYKYENKNR